MSANLTRLATATAEHLGEDHESLLLRSNAWREHAESLAFIGLHAEAVDAVDKADKWLVRAGSPQFDRARLLLTRASVLHQVRKGLDTIFQVREAADIFLNLGDKKQFVNARMIEAVILNQAGRASDALAVWTHLERDLGDDKDADSAAAFGMMFSTIAGCFRMLGDFAGARAYYTRAKEKFTTCGYTADVVKADWGLAKVAMCEGNLSSACDQLEYVVDRFAALAMRIDEALADLDRLDILLALGRNREARRTSKQIMRTFERVNMNRELLRAVAHLHDSLRSRSAASIRKEVIPSVREFFELSRTRAAARYEPPL
jgi:tetratricopeptide (TPR) repeat protein